VRLFVQNKISQAMSITLVIKQIENLNSKSKVEMSSLNALESNLVERP